MPYTGSYNITIGPEPGGTLELINSGGSKTFELSIRGGTVISGIWRHRSLNRLRLLANMGAAQLLLRLIFDPVALTFHGRWRLISNEAESGTLSGSLDPWSTDTFTNQQFIGCEYIDLDKISAISKFRSCSGHDFSDDFESACSMKHYFDTTASADIAIFSPVNGTVIGISNGWAGKSIGIQPDGYDSFFIILFHVSPILSLRPGTPLAAGQQIGWHIGSETMSDIAVGLNTGSGVQLLSYFDVMEDALFNSHYVSRGITDRADFILPVGTSCAVFDSYDPSDWVGI
ncbi:MAG: hypothetical protein Q9M23_04315 [Mariprofundaceae bacterium]|nr:hypothetical protein [Mariprofundaceae bacterium]